MVWLLGKRRKAPPDFTEVSERRLESILEEALRASDMETLQALIDQKCLTPSAILPAAVHFGSEPEIVDALLTLGADINAPHRTYRSALYQAVQTGSDDIVAYLLGREAKPTQEDFRLAISQALATQEDRRPLLGLLLQAGCDPTEFSYEGHTAGEQAGNSGAVDLAHYLKHAEKDYFAAHPEKEPVRAAERLNHQLTQAFREGETDKARKLLAKKPPEEAKKSVADALSQALYQQSVKTVKTCLDLGADPNQLTTGYNNVPPILAALGSHYHGGTSPEIFVMLLKAGASKETKDKDGRGIADYVAANDLHGHMPPLAEHKIDINTQDKEGTTPLMRAIQRSHSGTVLALLQAGAWTETRNNKGLNALCIAQANAAQSHHAREIAVRLEDIEREALKGRVARLEQSLGEMREMMAELTGKKPIVAPIRATTQAPAPG